MNGRFHILRPGETDGELLDSDQVLAPDGGPAEIFGSPAVAHGRVYFTTDEGLYCLGDGPAAGEEQARPAPQTAEGPAGKAVGLQLVPAESHRRAGRLRALRGPPRRRPGARHRRRRGRDLVDGRSGRHPERWRVHRRCRPRPRGRRHPRAPAASRPAPGCACSRGDRGASTSGRPAPSRTGRSPGTGSARRAASSSCAGWRARTCSTSLSPAAACSAPTSTSGPRT